MKKFKIIFLLKATVPDAQVSGFVGRRTSFEVKVNSYEIHSKLQKRAFPDFKEVVEIVQNVSTGGQPKDVEKMQSNCNIL